MNRDQFGRSWVTEDDLFNMLYCNPELSLEKFLVVDPEVYNQSIEQLHVNLPTLTQYTSINIDPVEFDKQNQSNWFMPKEYYDLDIAAWVLDQCKQDHELQRVGEELLLFQEKNLFPLLRYLKYLVDTMRANNIVWGVGRGSSVASYVLYLIGVHHIDSLYYDLPIEEFLKEEQ